MPTPDASVRKSPSRSPSDTPAAARRAPWWPLVLGACFIVAGLLLWHDAALNEALFRPVNDRGADAPAIWSGLSVAGLGLAAWIYLTAFAQRHPERVARLLWLFVVGGIVINQVKHHFSSPRPLAALGEGHLTVIGEALRTHSMPSGHSATAFAVMTLMLIELGERASAGRPAGSLPSGVARLGWVTLAVAIALSRLAVGAHWPGDALFGAGLGMLFAGLAPRAWPVGAMTRFFGRPAGRRAVALVLVVCALAIAATPSLFAAVGLLGSKLEKQVSSGYPLAEPLQWALALVAAVGAWRWWRAASATDASTP